MKKLTLILLLTTSVHGQQRFYPDDPLSEEPAPLRLESAEYRKLNDYYDVFTHLLSEPGESQPESSTRIEAQSTNTLDEAPDGAWFTNRIGSMQMTVEEVRRGPRGDGAPDQTGPWTITGAKTQGVTPGFQIEDARGERYLLKFDPTDHPEMATAADVIGSLLFHALGYHVPENYLVTFERDDLIIGESATAEDFLGVERPISGLDVNTALARVGRTSDGRIRAVASRFVPGTILGEFRYYGTRSDDFNDIVPHEHRRELRGLHVFSAWLNHNDSRAINTLDSLVEEGDLTYVKHFLIDFGATLGSASILSNTARDGNAYFFEPGQALAQMLTLGAYVPWWARADYFESDAVGMLLMDPLNPEQWKPNYPNPAFDNRLPDDNFWAAKKVTAFTDEHIRAIVDEGGYSDPVDREMVERYLMDRRDRIGQVYFDQVLSLDGFELENQRLVFQDLAVRYGLGSEQDYAVEWSRFDNSTDTHTAIQEADSFALPQGLDGSEDGRYFAATIRAENGGEKSVVVYVRRQEGETRIVGVERTW